MMDHSAHDMHAMHDMAGAVGFDYTLAFIAGVLGSGHCLGMCGALVSGYFMNAGKTRSYFPYLAYQISRISVYTLVGFAAAALGFVLVSSGMFGKIQSVLQMIIGSVVILLAFGILGWIPWQGSFRLIPMNLLRKGYVSSRQKGPVVGALMAGFLNGLMPCPLTFAMAVKATSAATVMEGGALMLTFGAGTLPTMLLISVAFGKLGSKIRGIMYKSAAFVMIFMGINTFYSGLSFYTEEDFKHRTFLHALKEKIDEVIVLLSETIEYINSLVSTIQGM
jgi:uncharacterized protein